MSHQCVDDFTLLSVIGKGSYAKVMLVRSKKDNKVYAMKVLKKKYILEKDQLNHIFTEKNILMQIKNPFLVQMKASFQDAKKLYFILEYCPGGELFGLLSLKDKLTEEQTKFYSAQIVLALEQLHKHGVIYRDLKPQNVLLDKLGYMKLTDFGLSKLLATQNQMANSICGTPEYLAPEILTKVGHGMPVDWWCLGCIIYEMVTGFPPFRHKNRNQLFDAILKQPFQIPQVSPKLQNLLLKLLEKNPNQRLGSKGAKQIKLHPWFQKVNWQSLSNKSIKAPFVPILSSDADISNFDEEFTTSSINSYSEHTSSLEDDMVGKFENFSFES